MERRLILAIALSLLILLAWSALLPKQQYLANKEVTTKYTVTTQDIPQQIAAPAIVEEPSATSLFNYTQDNFEIIFIEPQAAIKEVIFKTYQHYKFPLKCGFLWEDKSLSFNKQSSSSEEVTFVHNDATKKIIKKFIFHNSNYNIELEINIQNLSSTPITVNLPLILGALDFNAKDTESQYKDVTLVTKEKTQHLKARKNFEAQGLEFISLRDRYFCAIVEPELNNYSGFIKQMNPEESAIGLISQELVIAPGQQSAQKFRIYLGPQVLHLINSTHPNWSAVINFGTFDFIAQILLQLLGFFYGLVHNWGWAIVILSLVIYILLYPLTIKQMRSMKEMQALQPKIEELKRKYKGDMHDPKFNKDVMELYRQHKVNPFGGCLPLILQMPVFFALYQALMRSVALKGTHFLWIKDLSKPDSLLPLPFPKPFDTFNILPILMMIGMFVQQKISTASTASSTTAEQQKMMMVLMPLLFGFIFYSMPSGLVLYWFINSALMLVSQVYQLRSNRQ